LQNRSSLSSVCGAGGGCLIVNLYCGRSHFELMLTAHVVSIEQEATPYPSHRWRRLFWTRLNSSQPCCFAAEGSIERYYLRLDNQTSSARPVSRKWAPCLA